MKDMKKVKLLIAIPCGVPYVPIDFMMSIIGMDKPVEHTYDLTLGIIIDHARNNLVQSAIDKDCTHILFLDSDMTFPKDIIFKLLGHDKDIVGGLYVNRHNSTAVAYHKKAGSELFVNITEKEFGGVIEVDGIGTGSLLIKLDVFKNLPKPWFRFAIHKPTGTTISEDLMFCRLAQEQGYKVFCDTDCRCGHLVLQELVVEEKKGEMDEEENR